MSLDLSVHDKAVLNCIFNPSLPITEAYEEQLDELTDVDEPSAHLDEVKKREIDAIKCAENGQLAEALALINGCIALLPDKPSVYNNRAQIYQFMGRPAEALADLTQAIALATSGANGSARKSLCAALCQRGLVHRKLARVELARADFERAAELGSKFARTQLVELNPYAALCNQMLRKVMDDLN